MSAVQKITGIALAAGLAIGLVQAPANADVVLGETNSEWTPVAKLPELETGPQPGSVCETRGEVREYVELVGSHFDVEGTVSTMNDLADADVPLQQTLKEEKRRRWEWSAAISVKLTEEITRKYGWEYNREMFWALGQNIGPYPLHPGERGTMAWGFIMDDYTSQRVRCGASMTWEPIGRLQSGSAPRERHVEVKIENVADQQ